MDYQYYQQQVICPFISSNFSAKFVEIKAAYMPKFHCYHLSLFFSFSFFFPVCEVMVIERISHHLLLNFLGSNVVSALALVIIFKTKREQTFEKS